MAEPEVKKGSGIWIKLLLWGVVIVAGFLYLSAINDKQQEEAPSEESARTADSAAAEGGTSALPADPAAVPAAAIPAAEPSLLQEKARETPDSAPVTSPAPAITDIPPASPQVRAETAPLPGTLGDPPAAPSVGDAPMVGPESTPVAAAPPPSPQAAPATVPTVTISPDRTGVTEPAVAGHQVQPQSEVAGSEDSQPTQSHLPPPPGTSPEPAQPRTEAPAAGPAAPVPGSGTSAGATPERMNDRRARIMAEYEAMRQQRQDEMRRYWESMQRSRTPASGPHGAYPGYAPEYYRPW